MGHGLRGDSAVKTQACRSCVTPGIVVCIAVLIAAPLVWLSGGTVMQMTARSWLASPFYLASLVCLALAFVASRHGDSRPKLLFVLLFVGVFLSRLVFLATR